MGPEADKDPRDWPILPLDEEALARSREIEARHEAERRARPQFLDPPPAVKPSFRCRNITVTGFLGAIRIAHLFDQVVSLGSFRGLGEDLFPGHPSRLRLKFEDVISATPRELEDGIQVPTAAHIHGLFAFAEQGKSVLLHCQAGVSRSPAMAILLATHWGYPLEEILAGMDASEVYPNRLLLSLGEGILGLGPGALSGPVYDRLAGNPAPPPALPAYELGSDGTYHPT